MEKKVIDTGEIVCGFGVRKDYEGQKDFDQTYKEVKIKQKVKKIGDGDEDFIIEEFEEIKETPIKEVLAAQVDDVGIEAFMRPYVMANEEVPFVGFEDVAKAPVQDFTGFPEDPALSQNVHAQMERIWKSIDPELKGKYTDVESFLRDITQEKIDAYIASKVNVEKGKDDDK